MFTLSVIWAVLATGMIALMFVRKFAARNEDDCIHVNQASMATQQTTLAHTLDIIDRWGKTLTGIVLVYGLTLLAAFLYHSWQMGEQLHLQ